MSYNPKLYISKTIRSVADYLVLYRQKKGKDEVYGISVEDFMSQAPGGSPSIDGKSNLMVSALSANDVVESFFSSDVADVAINRIPVTHNATSDFEYVVNYPEEPGVVDPIPFEVTYTGATAKRFQVTLNLTASVTTAGLYKFGIAGRTEAGVLSQSISGVNYIQGSITYLLNLVPNDVLSFQVEGASANNGDGLIVKAFRLNIEEL